MSVGRVHKVQLTPLQRSSRFGRSPLSIRLHPPHIADVSFIVTRSITAIASYRRRDEERHQSPGSHGGLSKGKRCDKRNDENKVAIGSWIGGATEQDFKAKPDGRCTHDGLNTIVIV